MQLTKYEAARTALSEARSIDEVKQVKDKAEALRHYAKQSKDVDMVNWAAEIRIRAERRMGQMLKEQEKNVGGRPTENPSHDERGLPTLDDVGITYSMSHRAQKIADVPEDKFESILSEHKEQQKELTSATFHKLTHVSHNSGNNEWYTPEEILDSARAVMGGIDLDPASSEIANKTVKADKIYTIEDDGLKQEWYGTIWMNPPYAQPLISDFSNKLCESVDKIKIEAACVLVNNATETAWFQNMARRANAICFPEKRIRFIDPDGNPSGAPLQGQAILYYGDNTGSHGTGGFYDFFSEFGFVLVHV